MKKKIPIVYMVAGISSRFGGKIKQFAKVGPNDETLIEYSLNQAIDAGFSKIIFIVGNLTEIPFKKKFGESYKSIPIYYALQTFDIKERDRPWGTAEAVCSAKLLIDGPFVVCNGDDIYGTNSFKILINHLQISDDEATLGYILENVIPEYGQTHRAIFTIDKDFYVKSLKEVFNIEKKFPEKSGVSLKDLCSMNIFALHPKVLDLLEEELKIFKEKNKNDRKIEFLLPNEISKLIELKKIKMKIYPTEEKWYGITNPEDEEVLRNQLKNL
ncbi:MAG: sugar phosphate nucleotidyltransferase [Candidatus Pacearchaeota archaeon]